MEPRKITQGEYNNLYVDWVLKKYPFTLFMFILAWGAAFLALILEGIMYIIDMYDGPPYSLFTLVVLFFFTEIINYFAQKRFSKEYNIKKL